MVVGYITVQCSFGNGLQGYCCILFLALKEVDKLSVVEWLLVVVNHTKNLFFILFLFHIAYIGYKVVFFLTKMYQLPSVKHYCCSPTLLVITFVK